MTKKPTTRSNRKPKKPARKGLLARVAGLSGWRAVLFIGLAVLAVYALGNFVIAPRFAAWAIARIPEVHAVQTALDAQFPDKDIGVMDQTFYGPEHGGKNKYRLMGISVTGKDYLGFDEAWEIKTTVCSALGDKTKQYDAIMLQSTIENRFGWFFARRHKTAALDCSVTTKPQPPASDSDADDDGTWNLRAMPDSAMSKPVEGGNFQLQPDPDVATSLGAGDFQLQPSSREGYPDGYGKVFLAACTAGEANTYDACGCAVDNLMDNYSYKRAATMARDGVPEDLLAGWQGNCYLLTDKFNIADVKLP